jgi:hypothetical protein
MKPYIYIIRWFGHRRVGFVATTLHWRAPQQGWASDNLAIQSAQWCGRGDLNPHRHCCPTDFHTSYGFRRPRPSRGASLWSGLSLHHAPTKPKAVPEVRCCPSSLYTFPVRSGPGEAPCGAGPSRAWLGIAMEQGFPEFGQFCIRGFPRSTRVVSQVRCVYRFRHARVTRPLYRPAQHHGRRAA